MTGNNERTSTGTDRRTFLKSATAGAVAAPGILAGVGSTRPQALSPEEDATEKPDVEYKKVDKSVKKITEHYSLLTFSEDTVISNINDSDLPEEEKREAREKIIDLRSQYPVRKERDGNVVWLTLAKDSGRAPTEVREEFQQVNKAFRNGLSSDVSTQWFTTDHNEHTKAACWDVEVPDDDTDQIADWSEEPDHVTDDVSFPDNIAHWQDLKEAFEYGLKKTHRHWDHFYDTGIYWDYWCYHDGHGEDVGGIGGAPRATDDHMYWADYYDSYGYDSTRNKYLGYGLHFVEDVANPLHAGEGWEQLGVYLYYDSSEDDYVNWGVDPNHTTHDRYEEYASDNWTSGDYFRLDFRAYDNCCYYSIYDPASAVKGLADKAGEYSYDVYDTILNEEDDAHWTDWSSSTRDKMAELTSYLMEEEGKYVRGFLKDYF